jgi:hypothetical protein
MKSMGNSGRRKTNLMERLGEQWAVQLPRITGRFLLSSKDAMARVG